MAVTTLRVVVAGDNRGLRKAMQETVRDVAPAGRAIDKLSGGVRGFARVSESAATPVGRMTLGVRGMGTAIKIAGAAIVGSKIVDWVRDLADATAKSQASGARMVAQLHAQNISLRAHRDEIDAVIQHTSRLAGLDDEDLQDAFTAIVRTSGNVSTALRGTAIAADIARARHMDVVKAGELVAKVTGGNTTILKRYGITFDPVTKAQDKLRASSAKYTPAQLKAAKATDTQANSQRALAVLQGKFAGQAEHYGKTSAGAYDRFSVAAENLKETLGGVLAPAIGGISNLLSDVTDAASHLDLSAATKTVKGWADDIGGLIGSTRDKIDSLMHPAGGGKGVGLATAIGKTIAHGIASIDWAGIGNTLSTGLTKAIDFSGKLPGAIAAGIAAAASQVDGKKVLGALVDGLGQAADAAFSPSFWAKHIVGILSTIELVLPLGKILKIPGFSFLKNLITDNFNRIAGGIINVFKGVGGRAVVGFLGELEKIAPKAASALLGVITFAPRELLKLPGVLKNAAGDAVGALVDTIGNGAELAGEAFGKLAGAGINALKHAGGAIYGAAKDLAGAALHGLGSLLTAFYNFGKTIISKIVDGIKSAPGVVVDAVKGIVGKIPGVSLAKDAFNKIFGRDGGRATPGGFRRYAAGGVVAAVSPGEMVYDGQRTWTVPGHREPRDSVLTVLPVGAEVYTDHGQQLLAAGATRAQALAMQAPHFAAGGIVRAAQAARDSGLRGNELVTAVAIAGPESRYNPRAHALTSKEDSRGFWQINLLAHPEYRTANLYDPDVNSRAMYKVSDGGRNWQPWTGYTSGAYHAYEARARQAIAGTSSSPTGRGSSSPSASRTALGDRYTEAARAAGFEAGLQGATKIPTSLLRQIIAGSIGTRARVTSNSTRVRSARTASGPSSPLAWHPGMNTLTWARAFASRYGLRITSGYRSPARNAAVGGVPNSLHTHGSPTNPGAIDFVPPSAAALAAAKPFAREALIHDAGSGLHLHVGLFGRGGRVRPMRAGGVIGGLSSAISSTLRTGVTDKAGTTAAFEALAARLANDQRVSFAALLAVVRSAATQARADRRAGQAVAARRLDAVANLARAEEGVRLALPITRAQATATRLDAHDTHFDQTLQLHGIDAASAVGLTSSIAQQALDVRQLSGRVPGLKRALDRARKLKDSHAVTEITSTLKDIDDNVFARQAALADLRRQLPRQQATERIGRFADEISALSLQEQTASFAGSDGRDLQLRKLELLRGEAGAANDELANAQKRGDSGAVSDLTQQLVSLRDEIHTLEGTLRYSSQDARITAAQTAQIIAQVDTPDDLTDDLTALKDELSAATDAFAAARNANDAEAIAKYGQEVLGLRQALQQNTQALTESNQRVADATTELAAQQARLAALAQSDPANLMAALIAVVNGGIGEGLALSRATPMFAGLGARW